MGYYDTEEQQLDAAVKAVQDKIAEATRGYAERVESVEQAMKDIQQAVAGGAGGGMPRMGGGGRNLADRLVAHDEWKSFVAGQAKHSKISLGESLLGIKNTVTGDTGSPAQPGDTLAPQDRLPGVVSGAFRATMLRDVIPTVPASSNLIEFTREASWTNNAAPQSAEGEAKAESSLTFELVEASIRTTAHWLKVSKQALSDNPAIGSFIEARMRNGVAVAEQSGFLTGDGTGSNFDGLITNATTFTPTTGDTAIDSINRAAEDVTTGDFTADTVILNPADWFAITRLKNNEDDYYLGLQNAPATLWGLRVIATNSMTQGTLLVGDMRQAALIWDRQQATVELFEQDETNVQANLVTVRAENRSTISVMRPAALRAGDLTG